MSEKHIIKLTEGEAIVKLYSINANGETIDISLQNDLTRPNEVFVNGTSSCVIRSIYWGCKSGKQLDISRWKNATLEGHYYLLNSGYYEYKNFVDNTYKEYDFKVTGDGPFHCILVLGKSGWQNKIEPYTYGPYDNPNAVGS